MTDLRTEAFLPRECSDADIASFVDLVSRGGEVRAVGLEDRVRGAAALGFVRADQQVVAVGALKSPAATYRSKVFRLAGVENLATRYLHELGWYFVLPSYRSAGAAAALTRVLTSPPFSREMFATIRQDNQPAIRTVLRGGFSPLGSPFPSAIKSSANIVLFVKEA